MCLSEPLWKTVALYCLDLKANSFVCWCTQCFGKAACLVNVSLLLQGWAYAIHLLPQAQALCNEAQTCVKNVVFPR